VNVKLDIFFIEDDRFPIDIGIGGSNGIWFEGASGFFVLTVVARFFLKWQTWFPVFGVPDGEGGEADSARDDNPSGFWNFIKELKEIGNHFMGLVL
jgi:hypothetical protein